MKGFLCLSSSLDAIESLAALESLPKNLGFSCWRDPDYSIDEWNLARNGCVNSLARELSERLRFQPLVYKVCTLICCSV